MDITKIEVRTFNSVIVGSGAAAFNAANSLYELGMKDIAIVTEGISMGTSRNTGSDKQTYYKMSTCGKEGDSPFSMANTLFRGGAMHGDIALVEAALSTMCFYNLKRIGVPFPTDRYGQHVGYKTDHDPFARASSAGPLTSKYMTECLERQIKIKEIKIFDNHQVIAILKDEREEKVAGLLCINNDQAHEKGFGFTLFNCVNVIYCTGGPACLYHSSVYPKSQFGGTGIALEAGVSGINLTEWQYGLASTKFRWNVSGTYQQVLPRYLSTDQNMQDEHEFLCDYFDSYGQMCDAIFLKGYQWPFDSRKLSSFASSSVDILVYIETQLKGRRVFLDFTQNPSYPGISQEKLFSGLSKESYNYLANSQALFGKPIDRLNKMNPLAIDLYKNNGIDLYSEYLEIDVCAQHNNGGLQGDIWWESNLKGFFPVGEVAGTLGVYRPGGSALNSTQVGGLRAATLVSKTRTQPPPSREEFLKIVSSQVKEKYTLANSITICNASNTKAMRQKNQQLMTKAAAFFRKEQEIEQAVLTVKDDLENIFARASITSAKETGEVFRNYDMLICQYTYLSSMLEYIKKGGKSRGSFVVVEPQGEITFSHVFLSFSYSIDNKKDGIVCVSTYNKDGCQVTNHWVPVRDIPEEDVWFERVWELYRNDKIYTTMG